MESDLKSINRFYIVIATAGRRELIDRTLASLSNCWKPEGFYQTIVVENGPKTGAEEVVGNSPSNLKCQYVHVPKSNKSHALNAVLENLRDGLVFFADNDVRAHQDTLCTYAKAAAGLSRGQYYGGPTGVDYEHPPPEWLKDYLPASARGWKLDSSEISGEIPLFLGFNWAAFVTDLKDAGGFNPKLGPGAHHLSTGDETEMQAQLRERGVKPVYVPEAMVWHYVPQDRCSPKWALRRRYEWGIICGMKSGNKGKTILGFRPWMVKQFVKEGLGVCKSLVHKNPQKRFDAYYSFWLCCGKIRGARIAGKNAMDFSL